MSTRTHDLYRGDIVTVGSGKAEWFVTFAGDNRVIVTRTVMRPSGDRTMRRYFGGDDAPISSLKRVVK